MASNDNIKQIMLTQGQHAIVDSENYEYLMQWKWTYCDGYAYRAVFMGSINGKKKSKKIRMHRIIVAAPDGWYVDHINGDTLDNRRCNLRICTAMQNAQNSYRPVHRIGCIRSSKYKGVSYNKKNKNWRVQIQVNKKKMYVSSHKFEIEAASAYNAAAIQYFGEFAKLNEVPHAA